MACDSNTHTRIRPPLHTHNTHTQRLYHLTMSPSHHLTISPSHHLRYLSRSSSAPLDEVSTPRHAHVRGRKPFAQYGLDQGRRFGPVAFSRSASDSARRLPQPPPPPPRGNVISMASLPALARSLSGRAGHAGHAGHAGRASPLPLPLDAPQLERGLSYMSFATIASEGSPIHHALQSPPRFQSPVRSWAQSARSGSTSMSRESPLTFQSYPSLQSLPSFSNVPIGLVSLGRTLYTIHLKIEYYHTARHRLCNSTAPVHGPHPVTPPPHPPTLQNNKPVYDSSRSVASSGYSAEQEEADDVLYGSTRTMIEGRPQGPARPQQWPWPPPPSVLDQDHAMHAMKPMAELAVVTSPPPRPSTPVPRSLSASDKVPAENCELPVGSLSVLPEHTPYLPPPTAHRRPPAAIPDHKPLHCLRSSRFPLIGSRSKATARAGFVGWTTTPHASPSHATRWSRASRSRSRNGKATPLTSTLARLFRHRTSLNR